MAGAGDLGDDERTALVVQLRRSVVLHAAGDCAQASDLTARTIPAALRADHRTREEAAYTLGAHASYLARRDPATAAALTGACVALFAQANRPIPRDLAATVDATTATSGTALDPAAYRTARDRGATLDGAVLAVLAHRIRCRRTEDEPRCTSM
jgi:hypothetical protein